MPERETIAARLRTLMGSRSQSQWARELGVSQANISRYLSGDAPGPEFLRALAEAEKADIGWLLTGQRTPPEAGSPPADLTDASTEAIVRELSKRVRLHVDAATEMLDLARRMQRQIDRLECDESQKEP